MALNLRFGIVSDPHIGLPHTIWDHPSRFHLVEASIPGFEQALDHFLALGVDFLLLPGDLVQHGERENHQWLSDRLARYPIPTFVVPGNHDIIQPEADERVIDGAEFIQFYEKFGYGTNPGKLYYRTSPAPGLQLISLNSNAFDVEGHIYGYLDGEQLDWLATELGYLRQTEPEAVVLVMLHHNVLEHLPNQSTHPLGQRYMLSNAPALLALLHHYGVRLVFTGHLHVQDIAQQDDLYEITTGSLVSYPHPYRILQLTQDEGGGQTLRIESPRIQQVPKWADLPTHSRQWMGDRSLPFMLTLLTAPPLNLPITEARRLAPGLHDFWANVAQGDYLFEFPQFPEPVRCYFQSFGAIAADGTPRLIDNATTLVWEG